MTELVDRYAAYYEHPRDVDETIDLVGLTDKRTARSGRLSGGQQRRLDVALALVGDPELVFLDEPTTGFDPAARRAAWTMIEQLRQLGKTILLTTHYMDEAEALADNLAILVSGRVASRGTPATIGGRDHAPVQVRFLTPEGFDPAVIGATEVRRDEEFTVVTADDAVATVGRLVDWAARHPHRSCWTGGPAPVARRRVPRPRGAAVMNTVALVRREAGFARKILLRDPQNLFFTAGLPLLYLLIFATIFGDEVGQIPGQPGEFEFSTVMTASVIVIGVVSAAFQNLSITLIQDREYGVLKRLRSAPVPTTVFLGGHLVNALVTSVILAVGVAALGMALYGVPFTGPRTLAAVVTVFVGAVACAAAAFPFTRLVKKATAAAPMTFAVTLTLFFLSGNFFPGATMPRAMTFIADLFPVRHFFVAMLTAFNPNVNGAGVEWGELAFLVAWAVVAGVIGVRVFRWTPTDER